MTWSVDPPVRVGALACVAIVEMDLSVRREGTALSAQGEKRPVMFLILKDGTVSGIDVHGHRYDREEIEYLYPDAIAQASAHRS